MRQNSINGNGRNCVVLQDGDGYRIYDPVERSDTYEISGFPEKPVCSCGERDCVHVQILSEMLLPSKAEEGDNNLVNQVSSRVPSTMTIKRSVSPDGRIDSLSVEITVPVDGLTGDQIRNRSERSLEIQSDVVGRFLSNGKDDSQATDVGSDGSLLAELLDVGSINGRWGPRLFINVRAGDKFAKLFGTRNQLADHLRTAGYPHLVDQIREGISLNLPCRVTLKPSQNGRYLNVEEVHPPNGRRPQ